MALYNEAQLKQLIITAGALGYHDDAERYQKELDKLQNKDG